jgi:hypothetical protein
MLKMPNKVVCILGMHRSGTSLLAQWLSACGLHLGHRLMGAKPSNIHGHFEDLDFHDFHEEVFNFNNISYGGLLGPLEFRLNRYQHTKLQYLVKLKNKLNVEWGWKEPRTCLFIKEYREVLPNAFYLITYRDFREVVDSLIRRDLSVRKRQVYNLGWRFVLRYKLFEKRKIEKYYANRASEYLRAWISYNTVLLNTFSDFPEQLLVVNQVNLNANDRKIFSKLSNYGMNLNFVPFAEVYEKKLLTKSGYRKYEFDTHDLEKAQQIYNKLRELEQKCIHLC